MIFRITFSCEETDGFRRDFEADSEATFLDLHNAILKSVKYSDDQMTSFFLCNDHWEKEQEVTLMEMGKNFEYDNMIMSETQLGQLLEEQGQRLIYIFDPMFERNFFGRLTEIKPGHLDQVTCVNSIGVAPKQLQDVDSIQTLLGTGGDFSDMDEDFYGDNQYDTDDLDESGFESLSFDDGSMF